MAGEVIPFLGAGASLYDRNPKQTPFYQKQQGKNVIAYLPTGNELADYLAATSFAPAGEKGELTKMAQYFEVALGADPLRTACGIFSRTLSRPLRCTRFSRALQYLCSS
jgi:hypothetical protein